MSRQRKIAQMKEQIKTPEKELNEMDISNLSDAEFQTLVIMTLKGLLDKMEAYVDKLCLLTQPKEGQ